MLFDSSGCWGSEEVEWKLGMEGAPQLCVCAYVFESILTKMWYNELIVLGFIQIRTAYTRIVKHMYNGILMEARGGKYVGRKMKRLQKRQLSQHTSSLQPLFHRIKFTPFRLFPRLFVRIFSMILSRSFCYDFFCWLPCIPCFHYDANVFGFYSFFSPSAVVHSFLAPISLHI